MSQPWFEDKEHLDVVREARRTNRRTAWGLGFFIVLVCFVLWRQQAVVQDVENVVRDVKVVQHQQDVGACVSGNANRAEILSILEDAVARSPRRNEPAVVKYIEEKRIALAPRDCEALR